MDVVYLDNNATTRPAPEVVEATTPYLLQWYGNPSSVHRFGQQARQAIDSARASVAKLVGCADSELLFTCGGTESINTAVRGVFAARGPKRKIVTTTVEHSATRELCQQLVKDGLADVIEVKVNRAGELDVDECERELSGAVLVTFMWANNETGVIFPVARLAELCKAARVPSHCDATQALGKLPVNFGDVGVDLASFASHKFHGPKGAGALYVRRGVRFKPWLVGGPQERGRRGGTENVPAIVGMGRAAQLALELLPHAGDVSARRDRLERFIIENIPDTSVNGSVEHRLPNTTNISFARLEAEAILLLLSEQGICASAGAACSSGSLEPSHVIRAMGIDEKIAHGAVRFSLSRDTTDAEIDRTLDVLPRMIGRLRRVLPV